MGYITLIGIAVLLSGAFLLCKITNDYYDHVCLYYAEFLKLLYTLRQKIRMSSLSPSQILDLEDGFVILKKCSFLSVARERGLSVAYSNCESEIQMEKEDKKLLKNYFNQFGSDLLPAEVENIGMVIEALEKKYSRILDENPSKKRISSTMILCCTLMLIIMII